MSHCHVCGSAGKVWNKDPVVFHCTKCLSFYSEFGMVLDPQRETQDTWS